MPDASHSPARPSPDEGQLDVAIVGGGLAGLYAIHRLRGMGLKVRAYEAGSGVGGTWFWNRYPGARCDVESLEYSYSFSNELQQEWKWPERYGTQPEILRYINHVADRFDLRRDVQLNTRIVSAAVRRQGRRMDAQDRRRREIRARYCVMAAGNLSTPRVPDFKGLEDFKGKWYHSGLWPHEGVDFTGLRVGVIGTGSSGVQMIPLIARQARHLHVFQRTANFSLPARNGPMEPERERSHKADYPARRARRLRHALRHRRLSQAHQVGARGSRRGAQRRLRGQVAGRRQHQLPLCLHRPAGEQGGQRHRLGVRAQQDPRHREGPQRTAELLAPKDHPIGTKRLCLDTDYYETYNRDNVTLVDVRSDPIEEITATGLRTGRGRIRTRRHRLRHRLRRHDRRAARDRHPHDRRRGAGRPLGGRAAHLSRPDGVGLPQHVRHHRPRQPGREDADDPRSSSTSTGSPTASATCASTGSTASSPRRRPRSTGCTTSTRWPTARSIRWPTPGTWAPTSPASRACSCPMSAASTATSGVATPSPPRATPAR